MEHVFIANFLKTLFKSMSQSIYLLVSIDLPDLTLWTHRDIVVCKTKKTKTSVRAHWDTVEKTEYQSFATWNLHSTTTAEWTAKF